MVSDRFGSTVLIKTVSWIPIVSRIRLRIPLIIKLGAYSSVVGSSGVTGAAGGGVFATASGSDETPGMRSRLVYPPPTWEPMSIRSPRPSQIQSNPTIPPGNMMTYMSVVHGRKMRPRIPQMKFVNASCQRMGLMSHQIRIAARGPKSTNVVKKQHLFSSSEI